MKQTTTSFLVRAGIFLVSVGLASGAPATGTKPVSIFDPAVQMPAYSFQIPADWTFDGTVIPGPSCAPVPMPIWRVRSSDGIAEIKSLPPVVWTWGKIRQPYEPANTPKPTDCLSWNQEVSAAEFAKYMATMLQVELVKQMPRNEQAIAGLTASLKQLNDYFAANTAPGTPATHETGDIGAARVRYKVNGVPVEEQLNININCMDSPQMIVTRGWVGRIHTCTGSVTRVRAREGNLEAMTPVFAGIFKSQVLNQQWSQRWNAAIRSGGEQVRAVGRMQESLLQKQHADFMEAQARQREQHQAQMDVIQRGRDMANQRFQDNMETKGRIADDWCDYALDLQKRQDPGTGNIVKTSSQYSYSWLNEWGEAYNTNDANDNPNGRLKGNWTLQRNVR